MGAEAAGEREGRGGGEKVSEGEEMGGEKRKKKKKANQGRHGKC